MATSDVTLQDGVKHPYLLALVRWCVSSFWSTATVILHRFMTTPIPQIKAPKPARSRPASYDHLHPEPRVDCEVLHTPDHHKLDVIFVHGLYGSLGNTWRQGEWQTKYDKQPNKVPLRRPHAVPTCQCKDEQTKCCSGGTNNILTEDDEISQKNENTDTNGEIQRCNGDIDDEQKDENEITDKSYKRNAKYRNKDDNKDGISQINTKNDKFDKIRKENLRRDADIQKSDYNITKNDKISENNVNIDGFIDKIKDFEVQLPPSNFQEIMSGINVQNDHIKGLNGKINDCKANTSLYDTIRDINTQIDCNNYSNEDNMNAEDNPILYDNLQKILPKENLLITEKFYNNTLLDDVDIGSYETQAQFVKDLFENSVNKVKSDRSESENEVKASDCKCEVKCEPGCGCICDDCYSPCWPRDWVKVDYPGARVISINYTSDPYLWRPLWVKESKRLRLHERAEQMMSQLLDLGVGERPIIWVGHSKGGLFIKKMYCEAYEAHLKLTKSKPKEEIKEQTNEQNITESRNDNEINHSRDKETDKTHSDVNLNEINARVKEVNEKGIRDTGKQYINKEIGQMISSENTDGKLNKFIERIHESVTGKQGDEMNINVHSDVNLNELNSRVNKTVDISDVHLNNHLNEINIVVPRDIENKELVVNSKCFDEILMNNRTEVGNKFVFNDNKGEINDECDRNGGIPKLITVDEKGEKSLLNVNEEQLLTRARLWRNSAGFMFYSVPHRGSPLADIKTPITARSVELMEICKDCSLVLSLQEEWSVATAPTTPPVRSLVETCRTLMSVLYLRIVSVDSADPGIGSLNGVDVDHREICKPSSRSCLLYRELMTLMETALTAPRNDWPK